VVLSLDMGGLERIVLALVREGARAGHDVSVVCLERAGALAPLAQEFGVPVWCVGKRPGLHYDTYAHLRALLARLGPDVVHTHQVGALFYAGPAARRRHMPLVVHTEHGKHCGGGWRMRMLERVCGAWVQRFFCVSEDIAADLRGYHVVAPSKVGVIANGIDTATFARPTDAAGLRRELGIPAAASVLGTVGRLSEIKRQDRLLRAFAELRQTFPDAHLVLVGDGPLRDDLRQLAGQLKLETCVHFTGSQLQPERYLHLMDVFALTSRSEGMPVSVLEAWAAGRPVVASRVGGLPEMVRAGETGLLYEQDDQAALVAALARLLSDTALARRLGEAGRQYVEGRFTLRHMFAEYERHYRELLGANRGLSSARYNEPDADVH
jgi:glycosyltransferase involved in cell wall biosynthesis